jgi:hypothetical protein
MMLRTLAFALVMAATPALAADAVAPVKAVMDLTLANWASETGDGGGDYFDDTHIKVFSKSFRTLYGKVEKHMAEVGDADSAGVFDYDPIQGGQDGCPITDLKIGQPTAGKGGVTEVAVTFKPYSCFDGETKESVAHLTFKVVDEGGKAVIDDVVRKEFFGSAPSLVQELQDALAN